MGVVVVEPPPLPPQPATVSDVIAESMNAQYFIPLFIRKLRF
jgi:hypothetical protein